MSRPCIAIFVVIAASATGAGQGRGGFGGFGQEQALVERFDDDGNGRLDADERQAARTSLASARGGRRGRFGRRGGFGGRGFAEASPGVRIEPDDVQVFADEPLYDPIVLRTLFLEFQNTDWEDELAAFNNTDVEVPATVTVDNRVYRDVGVHFRGASSFAMIPAGSKRSLNLSFDFVDEDQRLLGYRTMNLLNVNSDPTFVRAVFYSHVASQYLPTPKMNYVRVVINGENWGVYVSAEQFNTDFTRDWFGSTAGGRWQVPGSPNGRGGMEYLGESVEAYRGIYEIRSRDWAKSWVALIEMFRVLNETPLFALEMELEPLLDIDGVLRFLALDAGLVNSDGYWTRASDYNIYQDEQGQFHVVPHDVNEAMAEGGIPGFGRGRGGDLGQGSGASLDPLVGLGDSTKPLRARLLAVPELRERYLGYVREIADTWLDWEQVAPLFAEYRDLIAADVERDTRKLYSTEEFTERFDGGTGSLKAFFDARRAFLVDAVP